MRLIAQRASLVAQAAQFLRDALDHGQWFGELPGERNLCARLGVSRPTLRAALEQLRREGRLAVTHGRPTRILQPRAKSAGAPRSVVAMLSPVPLRAMPPFVMHWVDELREQLAAAGCPLELHVSRTVYSPRPARALESLVRRAPAAAWVLYLSSEVMQRWFQERGLPCLVAGSCVPEVKLPSVDVDYRAACRHAVGLLCAAGCARIALVLPHGGYAGDREGEEGFREALARSSTKPAASRILRHDGTVAGLCAQLDSALGTSPPVDGFIVARSGHALTALTHLSRRGVRVPQEVAVVSRDDDAFLEFVVPRMARYTSDPAQFARRVARVAMQLAQQGFAAPRAVRLMPRYLAGETV
ncbi:MAG: substrate-binding domain-containing protein [Verrucomicrobia bacterium]|nr:substrate-binding domain-containing protein [Verrucomicrobiota bacterium]